MKPTIRQLLNDLPEPYRSKALANEENKLYHIDWDLPFKLSKENALAYAFLWKESFETESYWIKISEDLKSGKIQLKPLPRKIIERALSLGLECEIICKDDCHYKITNNYYDIDYKDIKTIKFKKI